VTPARAKSKPLIQPIGKPVTSLKVKAVVCGRVPKRVFGKEGKRPGEKYFPAGASVHKKTGNIYVADDHRICVYNKKAKYLSSFDVFCKPRDICFTQDGMLAITGNDDKVTIYNLCGEVQKRIGQRGKDLKEFDNPVGIATCDDALLYVCDCKNNRVQVLDNTGSVVRVIGARGPGKLAEPVSVAIHPHTRNIYVADYHINRVHIYAQDGQYLSNIGQHDIPGVSGFNPRYVSFSGDGSLCISDTFNHCVHIMHNGKRANKHTSASGVFEYVQQIGKRGQDEAEFRWPRGTTFSYSGDLIICDTGNQRVQLFAKK
jgi:DNA-binding beta-propeller fold protein YncE